MKFVNLVLCVLLLAFNNESLCQDIDSDKTPVKYVVFPKKKLDSGVRTYSFSFEPISLTKYGNSLGWIEGMDNGTFHSGLFEKKFTLEDFTLKGYELLPIEKNPDVNINLKVLSQIQYSGPKVVSEERKSEGNTTYTAYYCEIHYVTPKVHCEIVSRDGKLIDEITTGGEPKMYESGSNREGALYRDKDTGRPMLQQNIDHRSAEAAKLRWDGAEQNVIAKFERQSFNEDFNTARYFIRDHSIQIQETDNFKIKFVDEGKKKTVYKDLLDAKNYCVEGITLLNTFKIEQVNRLVAPDTLKANELLRKAILIWEENLKQVEYENRKARIDRKVAECIINNLIVSNMLLFNYTKAKQYTKEPFEKAWSKKFKAESDALFQFIDELHERFQFYYR